MADHRSVEDDILDDVKSIRAKNNDLWMKIVAVALKADPITTKRLMRHIAANDSMVVDRFLQIGFTDPNKGPEVADAADDPDCPF